MRITLTLDGDVGRWVEEAAHRERRPLNDIINEALRRALAAESASICRVVVHDSPLRAGVDQLRLNQLADDAGDISSA